MNSDALTLPAPAKLNLFLHILGRRPDGYHNLQTVFQFVDFCDYLTFKRHNGSDIFLSETLPGIAPRDNLMIRAAKLLHEVGGCGLGAEITIDKRLPIGAGVGGGSSDAATTLLALNYLWDIKLSINELASLGIQLGADVPVFVRGHAAWAEGVGERLTPMILPEPWYILLVPKCHVSTERLFADPRLSRDTAKLSLSEYRPGQGHNDFEAIVREDYPEVAQALNWLDQFSPAQMSGSGGVVFAAFDSEEEAGRIAAHVPPNHVSVVVAKGLNRSPLHEQGEQYWGVAKR